MYMWRKGWRERATDRYDKTYQLYRCGGQETEGEQTYMAGLLENGNGGDEIMKQRSDVT